MTMYVVIENGMHCATSSWSLFGKLFDNAIFKNGITQEQDKISYGVKTVKILIKIAFRWYITGSNLFNI